MAHVTVTFLLKATLPVERTNFNGFSTNLLTKPDELSWRIKMK
jgi:hypothetical protein